MGVGICAVVGDDEFGERTGGKDNGHDEGKVEPEPGHVGDVVASDGMRVDVAVVDFKVDHVEGEGLDEAEDGFAEKRVDAEGGLALVEEGYNGVAEDDSDEGVGSLGWGFV